MDGDDTMSNKTKLIWVILVVTILFAGGYYFSNNDVAPSQTSAEAHGDHDDDDDHADEPDNNDALIPMTADERRAQSVSSMILSRRELTREITVPGEVTLDLYNSSLVTPRIRAQVTARHARLGDLVVAGQPIVTLSSVEMARAQGELIVSDQDWQRVSELGNDVVSGRRFLEAQVAAQQARATVEAFGMASEQIQALLEGGDVARATGSFTLVAQQNGTIVSENFVLGEFVEAGHQLFTVSDESRAWVNARLSADQAAHIEVGTKARISVDNQHVFEGSVIQVHHTLNEATRTLPVRIEVINGGDELHPGQFVEASIVVAQSSPVLGVPAEAVALMDGVPNVFLIEGDLISPQPIEVGGTYNGWVEVKAGVSAGDEVVITNVFLLKSLLLKSRMGEGHGH
jgi:membrane fusion protein, heavy metal efflux system